MELRTHIRNFLASKVLSARPQTIAHEPPQVSIPDPQSLPPPAQPAPQPTMRVAFARSTVSTSQKLAHTPPATPKSTTQQPGKLAMKAGTAQITMGNFVTTGHAGLAVSYTVKKPTDKSIQMKRTGLAPQKQQPFLVTAIIKTLPARFKQERIDTAPRSR